VNRAEAGGLSGKPVKEYSLKALRTLRSQLPSSIVTIGCGGIFNGADALEFARAGASLVQVYTGFGYDGVGFCRRIKDEVVGQLAKEGTTWSQVVKQAVDELSLKTKLEDQSAKDLGTASVNQLIAEAHELQGLLDQLDKKIDALEPTS
jgi:dihydroorotate dehydrogenase